jgi:hypothetical protein
LRKNLMIVVSIALPLLVILFFALASVLPGLYTTPSAYDFLLTLQGVATAKSTRVRIDLTVIGGQVKAVASQTDGSHYDNYPRLFRYHHLTGEVTEISIPIPESISGLDGGSEIPIPELAGLRISDKLRAPDGYEFSGSRRGGGFVTELFGGSRKQNDVRISKNGAVVRVRLPTSDSWYNGARFVGWVLNGEE